MTGVFDRLQQEINNQKKEMGFSVLDLADLSPALRKLMRLILREGELNYTLLKGAAETLPSDERMSQADLDNALGTLTASSWLTKSGVGDGTIYKVNLKRRSASTLPSGIWNALETKLKNRQK